MEINKNVDARQTIFDIRVIIHPLINFLELSSQLYS